MNGNKNSPWSASDYGDSIVFCCPDHVMITVRNRNKSENGKHLKSGLTSPRNSTFLLLLEKAVCHVISH